MRLPDLDLETLTPRQRELYDRIGGRRGHVRGPFLLWIRSPELCDKVEALGAFCRFESDLNERIRELSLLIAARFFDAEYSWAAHADKAVAAGVSQESVDELAANKVPNFVHEDETVLYNFSTELLNEHFVSDENFTAALKVFGERGLIDIIGCLGNYSMLAMLLNTFHVKLREGTKKPFTDVLNFAKI